MFLYHINVFLIYLFHVYKTLLLLYMLVIGALLLDGLDRLDIDCSRGTVYVYMYIRV